jgi:drug/metabolite transporter (DMT)-like permease
LTPYPPSSSPEAASLDELITPLPGARTATAPRESSSLVWLAFTSVCLFWGTSGPLLRYTVRYVEPLWLVVARFFLGGVLLWLLLWILGRSPPIAGLVKLVPSGLGLALTNVLCTLGFQRVEAGAGSLLLATTAVAFAVVEVCWPGGTSTPSASVWFGLLLGLLGVAVLVVSPQSFGGGAWQGYLMLALSCWTWALCSVGQARHPSGLDPLQSSTWQMLIAAGLVLPVAAMVGGGGLYSIALKGWLGIVVLTLTATLFAFVSFVYVLHRIPAHILGSYTYVNAIVAAGMSVLWLGERLPPRFYVAALLVLGGVALIQRRLFTLDDGLPRETRR